MSTTVRAFGTEGPSKATSVLLNTFMETLVSPILAKRILEYSIRSLSSKSVLRQVNGFTMLLSLKEPGINRDLFLYGKREPHSTDLLASGNVVCEGQTVLDIGANIGYYVLLESHLVGKTGRVYAIEPVIRNCEMLGRNLKLNNIQNVRIYNLAMGDKHGYSEIYVADKCNVSAMTKRNPTAKFKSTQKVFVVTVDSFLELGIQPDLVRMDVEGYEVNILRGMHKLLATDVKLMIELHGAGMTNEETNEVIDTLEAYRFKVAFAALDHELPRNRIATCLRRRRGKVSVVVNLDLSKLRNHLLVGGCVNALFCK